MGDDKTKKFDPVYLFVGDDTFLIEEEIDRVKKEVSGNDEFSYAAYNADEHGSIEEMLSLCNTLPFLTASRVVILRNFEKATAEKTKKILDYINNPSRFTALILVMNTSGLDGKDKKRISEDLIKKYQNAKIRRFDSLKPDKLTQWVQMRVKKYSKEIDLLDARHLAEISGWNSWFIAGEIEKLCLYKRDRKKITGNDIDKIVANSHEELSYNFIDDFFSRKQTALLKLLELEHQGLDISFDVLPLLQNSIVQHYKVFHGLPIEKHIPAFVVEKIASRKNLWKSSELETLQDDVRMIEQNIKTGKASRPYVALAAIVARYANRKKAA